MLWDPYVIDEFLQSKIVLTTNFVVLTTIIKINVTTHYTPTLLLLCRVFKTLQWDIIKRLWPSDKGVKKHDEFYIVDFWIVWKFTLDVITIKEV